jgi:hypothetical protein
MKDISVLKIGDKVSGYSSSLGWYKNAVVTGVDSQLHLVDVVYNGRAYILYWGYMEVTN